MGSFSYRELPLGYQETAETGLSVLEEEGEGEEAQGGDEVVHDWSGEECSAPRLQTHCHNQELHQTCFGAVKLLLPLSALGVDSVNTPVQEVWKTMFFRACRPLKTQKKI